MPIWIDEKKIFEVSQDEFYNQLYKHTEPSKLTLQMIEDVKKDIKIISKKTFSRLTFGKYLIILIIEIGILTTIFGYVFNSIDVVTQRCDAHIVSHAEITEQIGELKAKSDVMIEGQKYLNQKVDKIFEIISK